MSDQIRPSPIALSGKLEFSGPDGAIVLTSDHGSGSVLSASSMEALAALYAAGAYVPLTVREIGATRALQLIVGETGQPIKINVNGETVLSIAPGSNLLGRLLGWRDAKPIVHRPLDAWRLWKMS
ncbi:hypothetical protein [Stratiformator vulcanicus]|uniref:Uncharacterized protein n=1 Tax=Stratiformator vulcanicus TaxID=2527980 RepID=A0A517R5S4_9PLAN|nr:hypothetical protein [Stratiformator vulcanicus]QDT39238.1 hypothetical protein Pan189_36420 [Stratiformator vulcanicus]